MLSGGLRVTGVNTKLVAEDRLRFLGDTFSGDALRFADSKSVSVGGCLALLDAIIVLCSYAIQFPCLRYAHILFHETLVSLLYTCLVCIEP